MVSAIQNGEFNLRGRESGNVFPALLIAIMIASSLGCAITGVNGGNRRSDHQGITDRERQLTFAGLRSGEGYFDPSGREIVFQSERDPENPFYQIFRMNLASGRTTRISAGVGKTTCAWIHPQGGVLFASTHLDPNAASKQVTELEVRASGNKRRYAWNFDPQYDLFLAREGLPLKRVTEAFGYDAEASYSPDGRWLAFSSNRHAYSEALAPEDRERLAEDPSYFIDLYLLDTQNGDLRRITSSPGYDGGAFFSPDGQRLVWRRFSVDGSQAEIHTIGLNGEDERVLTRLGVMSWAPFYHPSGDYIIFTTNLNGFDNFELYIVDAEGKSDPVRVTTREGFDGLPVFSPGGDQLLWTSNRTAANQSQLFLAEWNDGLARRRLGLRQAKSNRDSQGALAPPFNTIAEISPVDIAQHVSALTDERADGRRAGSDGERVASDYVTRVMQNIGLDPAGADGRYLHPFDFTSGISLGSGNRLVMSQSESPSPALEIDSDWRPLAFSRSGEIPASAVVFAGYGLVAPAYGDEPALDAYANLDLNDRWVMIFRGLPHSLKGDRRQHLQRHASLRYKAMLARDRGARGVLFVSGPQGRFRNQLLPLRFDASLAGTRIAVVSISDSVASRMISGSTLTLVEVQRVAADAVEPARSADSRIASPDPAVAFEIADLTLAGRIDLETQHASGNNVLGRLRVGDQDSLETIVIGAHYDHLGHGEGSGSFASGNEVGEIHPGADDNASGTAVLLEIAEQLTHQRKLGTPLGQRDFVFAAWSGEELGLLGSARWVADHVDQHTHSDGIVAYLNMDMVGRLRSELVMQGLGSSSAWAGLLERAAAPLDLAIVAQQDSYLPTDATSFYTNGIPILSAFTGVHSEYHTPRDTLDRLNLEGAAQIGKLIGRVAIGLSQASRPPEYHAQEAPSTDQTRSSFRVFLGTVPDYAQTAVTGVRLSGVSPGGPAAKAGLRGGDIIVEVDQRPIENLYDYTYALEALRVGEPSEIVILRDGQRRSLEVVPGSRD